MDMTMYGAQIVESKLKLPAIVMDAMKAAVAAPTEPQLLFCKPQALAEMVDVFRQAL